MTPLSTIHFKILLAVATYRTLTRAQLQELCQAPGVDPSGRNMRKHLTKLLHDGLINQAHGRVVFPDKNGAPSAVYYPSRMGCEVLAAELKDERYLGVCCQTPEWTKLYHWTEISRLHVLFDQAAARQKDVAVENWLTEWDLANAHEKAPEKRYSLFTLLQENPRLVCAPDAGCVVAYRGFKKAVYFEIDRMTSGVNQIAASKTPGYAKLAELRQHVRHFPSVKPETPFTVIHVSPTAGRRDLVCGAVATKPAGRLFKFTAWADLRPETLLHEPILRDCEGNSLPLVRRIQEGPK